MDCGRLLIDIRDPERIKMAKRFLLLLNTNCLEGIRPLRRSGLIPRMVASHQRPID